MFKRVLTAVVIGLALMSPQNAFALAMRFVDVTLENVEPGASFNLRTLKNLPLVIVNQDDVATDVIIEVVLPEARELKAGYEPIPDPSWLQIVPPRFHLGPRASAAADMVVTIPTDQKYVGHHYECIIYARTDRAKEFKAQTGVRVEMGLRSRFRLSIGTPGPESLRQEKIAKKLASINTKFSISPDNLYFLDADAGKTLDLKQEKKISLKVINESDDSVSLKFKASPADPNNAPQAGYEDAPDPSWLQVMPASLAIPGNSIKELKLQLKIPDKPEFHNKKYMFLILTTLGDESLPLAYYNRLYVTTKP